MRLSRLFFPFILIFLCSYSNGLFGQTSSVVIKFNPFALINPKGPNVQLGAEYVKGKWSYGSDIGVFLTSSSEKGDYRIADRRGIKIRPEVRYYFKPDLDAEKPRLGPYVAGELSLVKDHFKLGDTFVKEWNSDGPDDLFYDYHIISRYEASLRLKIGTQVILWKRLALDMYVGMGLRYNHATFEYRVPYENCCPVMRFFETPIYTGFRPLLALGVKVGMRI